MKHRTLPLVGLVFLFLLLTSLAFAQSSLPVGFLNFVKDAQSVPDLAQEFQINVTVDSQNLPIVAAQAVVHFNPSQVEFVASVKTDSPPLPLVLFANDKESLAQGKVVIGGLINLGDEQKKVNGSIALLTFRLKSNTTEVSFDCTNSASAKSQEDRLCSKAENKESCNFNSAILNNVNNDGNPDHTQNIISCSLSRSGRYGVGTWTTPPFERATPTPDSASGKTPTPTPKRAGTPTSTPYPWDRFLTPRPGEATPTQKPVCDLCGKCGDAIPKNYEQCKNCNAQPKHTWTQAGCVSTETGGFVQTVVNFVLPIAAGLAFLAILWGGFMMATSQGDMVRVMSGRNIIIGAIVALLLVLFSTFLLRLVGFDILGLPGFGGGK